MKRRFLMQPQMPRLVVHEIFNQFLVLLADKGFQLVDDLLLSLHVHRLEELVLVQDVEQLVVLGGRLILDVAEAGIA